VENLFAENNTTEINHYMPKETIPRLIHLRVWALLGT